MHPSPPFHHAPLAVHPPRMHARHNAPHPTPPHATPPYPTPPHATPPYPTPPHPAPPRAPHDDQGREAVEAAGGLCGTSGGGTPQRTYVTQKATCGTAGPPWRGSAQRCVLGRPTVCWLICVSRGRWWALRQGTARQGEAGARPRRPFAQQQPPTLPHTRPPSVRARAPTPKPQPTSPQPQQPALPHPSHTRALPTVSPQSHLSKGAPGLAPRTCGRHNRG